MPIKTVSLFQPTSSLIFGTPRNPSTSVSPHAPGPDVRGPGPSGRSGGGRLARSGDAPQKKLHRVRVDPTYYPFRICQNVLKNIYWKRNYILFPLSTTSRSQCRRQGAPPSSRCRPKAYRTLAQTAPPSETQTRPAWTCRRGTPPSCAGTRPRLSAPTP